MGSQSAQGPGIALRDYGLAELAMAIDALAWRGSRRHAGIHHARKGIRRTRAMLALGASVLGPGAHLIDRQLHRMNRRLSPLRDAHALVETLDRLSLKARGKPARMVLDRARRIAVRRRVALARKPEFAQALQHEHAVLLTLCAALQGLPWECLAASKVAEAMATAVQKAEAARQRAYAHDDAEDWHRWRRFMRRISQQHRAAFATDLADPASRFDKSLTEQLGVMQDLNLLVKHCDRDSTFPESSALRRLAEQALARQRKLIRSVVAHL